MMPHLAGSTHSSSLVQNVELFCTVAKDYSSYDVFNELCVALEGDFAAATQKYSHNTVWIDAVVNYLRDDAVMVEHAMSSVFGGKLLRFASTRKILPWQKNRSW